MRVVMVACVEPQSNRPSGIATYVENILEGLVGHDVDATLVGCGDVNGVDVPYSFISVSKDTGITSASFLARLMSRASSLEIPHDAIIHTHKPDDAIPFLLSRRASPNVVTLHGSHARNVLQNWGQLIGSAYGLAERYSLRRSDRVVSVSMANKEFYAGKYPWLREKLVFVPQGVDTGVFTPIDMARARSSFGFSTEEPIVLFAGRFEKEKRLGLLIDAFRELSAMKPKARLVLVGKGREEEAIRSLVARRGVENVTFRGPVSRKEMPLMLNCADVFALLSVHEGLPLAVLEALSCGVPVVATPVGDLPLLIREGITGRLVSDLDPKSIAKLMREVMDNRSAYSDGCRQVALERNWDVVVRRMVQIYEEVQHAGS